MDFPTTRYPYGFSDHLLHLFFYLYFTISSANGSQQVSNYFCHLSLSIIIALPASPKFRQLLFSFRKVWGYPTSLTSWFIKFQLSATNFHLFCFCSVSPKLQIFSRIRGPWFYKATPRHPPKKFTWWRLLIIWIKELCIKKFIIYFIPFSWLYVFIDMHWFRFIYIVDTNISLKSFSEYLM